MRDAATWVQRRRPEILKLYETEVFGRVPANAPKVTWEVTATANTGATVTKTVVVVGDPSVTTTPDHPRGAMLRAYDKATGKEVGAVWMPAAQSGSPMTYLANGRQYIIVAVSGGNYSGEYIAYALPQNAR